MFRWTVLSVVAAAALSWSAGAALAESRMALVIGQSAYRAVTPLPNPANDAKAMAGLLGDAGFEVTQASDLSQNALRQAVSDFAAQVSTKGPDTVALVFYAGHGMQIDGENFLVPVDIDPRREADIPLQAVRLNDILNTLTSVPSRMRLVLLDACRNNPFPNLGKTAGRGLAIVDARFGAPGTFLSFSTSPGAEAEDGSGANSPYTTALLSAAREPGVPIEDAFKRVRVAVNKATEGRQTPWESSSLTDDFRFFGTAGAKPADAKPADAKPADAKPAETKSADAKSAEAKPAEPQRSPDRRSLDQWKAALQGKSAEAAHEMIVADGSVEAYEAFIALYTDPVFVPRARVWLERQLRMIAWNKAVLENTAAGYRAFLLAYPDSDLTATARKLEQRLRNRPSFAPVVAALPPAASCSCSTPPAAPAKKTEKPSQKKRASAPPPRRSSLPPPPPDADPVPVNRPPPIYVPMPGISIGGGTFGGGRFGGGRHDGYTPPNRGSGMPTPTTSGPRRGY